MSAENRPRPAGPAALAVTLTVPSPWAEAVAAVAEQLAAEFELGPLPSFAPHVSLCRPFCCSTTPDAVAPVVSDALRRLPLTPVRVGGVSSFHMADGSPEVVYVSVQAPWLPSLNRQLVERTEAYRCGAEVLLAVSGNPDYDLDGYTPHVTIVMTRTPHEPADRRHALAARAAALWAERRPPGDGFAGGEVVLSVLDADGADWPPLQVPPHTIRTWRLDGGGRVSGA
jgi:2'-5' RNA ligase